jgi:glucose/arabinose dehydrogenase
VLAACASPATDTIKPAAEAGFQITGSSGTALQAEDLETFDSPWAMAFLPDGRALVTLQAGEIWLLKADGTKAGQVTGGPGVEAKGQGGLGDVILHPDFAATGQVYISYVERDAGNEDWSGAAVALATLELTETGGVLRDRSIIWRQSELVPGNGHYGHRLAISPDRHLLALERRGRHSDRTVL